MKTIRTESDTLGQVKLPAKALYGAQTARAIENYPISGRTSCPELIRAYLRIKWAAARVNEGCGVLEPKIGRWIRAATSQLLQGDENEWPKLFPVDIYQAGAGTSLNMNLNEVIANLANQKAGHPLGSYRLIHPNNHVNCSQSTNDTFPTAARLALLEASRELDRELQALARALAVKARKWNKVVKAARTHLQDAVPMTLGQEFSGYASVAEAFRGWLQGARAELMYLGIGGTAAGTGLNAPRSYRSKMIVELARMTREDLRPHPNLFEAMQSQGAVAHYSGALRLIALELTRICNDLRLLASGPHTGLAELRLPAVQPGSSIMPGKVNPSILEMVNQVCFAVLGLDHTVAMATQAGQLELNVMMPVITYSALDATRILKCAVHQLHTRVIEGLEPNAERLRAFFESSPQIATALSPKIGYEATAELVKEAAASGKTLLAVIREKKLLSPKELKALSF